MFQLVFVLGPGRSGTSAVAQLLNRIDVSIADDRISADPYNPDGYWEDRFVVDTHHRMLEALGALTLDRQCIPLPDGWKDRPEIRAAERALGEHVEGLRDTKPGPWAVKSPDLCLLWPVWQRVCHRLDVPYRVVLSLRHPGSVTESLARLHRLPPAVGEGVWLNRVAHVLRAIDTNLFVVHYEHLLVETSAVAGALYAFVHGAPPAAGIPAGACAVVRDDLDRARCERGSESSLLERLYAGLRGVSGTFTATPGLRALVDEYFERCAENVQWLACIEHACAGAGGATSGAEDEQRQRERCQRALFDARHELARARSALEQPRARGGTLGWLATAVTRRMPGGKANARRIGLLTDEIDGLVAVQARMTRQLERITGRAERRGAANEVLRRRLANRRGEIEEAKRGSALIAWGLKRVLTEHLAGALEDPGSGRYDIDFPRREESPPSPARAGGRRRRVLYVGPAWFRESVWDTRAKYIFPDLFEELADDADIYMLTGSVPPFANPGIEALEHRFGITHLEAPKFCYVESNVDFWFTETLRAAREIEPDVITNVFGATLFGYGIGMVARLLGKRAVVRVAGDEIATKSAGNWYDGREPELRAELLHQNLGFALADAVISMAPWEQRRIQSVVTERSKVHVCVRGVDVDRSHPRYPEREERPRRFLYVGRKSFEKGYDIIEAAAVLVAREAPEVEFVFAGNFAPGRTGNVHYRGFVQPEDLPALYADADAFILVSRTEGFPQAMAEAMACGLACILSRAPFAAMFDHERDVLLCDLDAEALAECVVRLHRDPALNGRLAARSRIMAEKRMDRRLWRGSYRQVLLGEAGRRASPDLGPRNDAGCAYPDSGNRETLQ